MGELFFLDDHTGQKTNQHRWPPTPNSLLNRLLGRKPPNRTVEGLTPQPQPIAYSIGLPDQEPWPADFEWRLDVAEDPRLKSRPFSTSDPGFQALVELYQGRHPTPPAGLVEPRKRYQSFGDWYFGRLLQEIREGSLNLPPKQLEVLINRGIVFSTQEQYELFKSKGIEWPANATPPDPNSLLGIGVEHSPSGTREQPAFQSRQPSGRKMGRDDVRDLTKLPPNKKGWGTFDPPLKKDEKGRLFWDHTMTEFNVPSDPVKGENPYCPIEVPIYHYSVIETECLRDASWTPRPYTVPCDSTIFLICMLCNAKERSKYWPWTFNANGWPRIKRPVYGLGPQVWYGKWSDASGAKTFKIINKSWLVFRRVVCLRGIDERDQDDRIVTGLKSRDAARVISKDDRVLWSFGTELLSAQATIREPGNDGIVIRQTVTGLEDSKTLTKDDFRVNHEGYWSEEARRTKTIPWLADPSLSGYSTTEIGTKHLKGPGPVAAPVAYVSSTLTSTAPTTPGSGSRTHRRDTPQKDGTSADDSSQLGTSSVANATKVVSSSTMFPSVEPGTSSKSRKRFLELLENPNVKRTKVADDSSSSVHDLTSPALSQEVRTLQPQDVNALDPTVDKLLSFFQDYKSTVAKQPNATGVVTKAAVGIRKNAEMAFRSSQGKTYGAPNDVSHLTHQQTIAYNALHSAYQNLAQASAEFLRLQKALSDQALMVDNLSTAFKIQVRLQPVYQVLAQTKRSVEILQDMGAYYEARDLALSTADYLAKNTNRIDAAQLNLTGIRGYENAMEAARDVVEDANETSSKGKGTAAEEVQVIEESDSSEFVFPD